MPAGQPPNGLSPGLAATIGFRHNKNRRALTKSLDRRAGMLHHQLDAGRRQHGGEIWFQRLHPRHRGKDLQYCPCGTAIGLLNNTSYTVLQLIDAANANCSGGMLTAGAFNALTNIFDGINSSGDISG